MTVLGQWSHQSSFTVNPEMHRLHLRLRKTQETSYAVFISGRLLIIHSANMFYQQVSNFGEVSELCCCYQSLHAGIPPLSLLLFSHTFFPLPPPTFLFPLHSDCCLCLWWCAESCQSKFFFCGRNPEGVSRRLDFSVCHPYSLLTNRFLLVKIVSHCDVAVTFHSAQFLTLYYQSSVVL